MLGKEAHFEDLVIDYVDNPTEFEERLGLIPGETISHNDVIHLIANSQASLRNMPPKRWYATPGFDSTVDLSYEDWILEQV